MPRKSRGLCGNFSQIYLSLFKPELRAGRLFSSGCASRAACRCSSATKCVLLFPLSAGCCDLPTTRRRTETESVSSPAWLQRESLVLENSVITAMLSLEVCSRRPINSRNSLISSLCCWLAPETFYTISERILVRSQHAIKLFGNAAAHRNTIAGIFNCAGNQVLCIAGCIGAFCCQVAHLVGQNGEPLTGFARPGSLHSSVERESGFVWKAISLMVFNGYLCVQRGKKIAPAHNARPRLPFSLNS